MKTLALIPARGGSKGIAHKNTRQLAGKPLIAWTILAALASTEILAVVVSTDDPEIAEISLEWGASVPFLRPADLATDHSPIIDTIMDVIDKLTGFDNLLLLQPTSPLRTVADIEGCLAFARQLQAHAVVSVCEPAASPYWTFSLNADQELRNLIASPDPAIMTRRQDLPVAYALNGALYFANINWLKKNRSFLTEETKGYVMPQDRSVDIDSPLDWDLAELLMARRNRGEI